MKVDFQKIDSSATSKLPLGWSQFALPSQWKGLSVGHVGANSSEIELRNAGTVCISMVKRSGFLAEMRTDGARWGKVDSHPGMLSSLPVGFAGSARWTGWLESISATVDLDWLFGADEKLRRTELAFESLIGFRDNTVAAILLAMYEENLRRSPQGRLYAESLALDIVRLLCQISKRSDFSSRVFDCGCNIDDALEFVHAFSDSQISVRDIAKAAGWSSNLFAFTRLFKRRVGQSPHQYTIDVRISRAKALLLRDDANLTAVAASCGFGSLSHFSGVFKHRVGIAPSLWKAQKGL